MTMEYTTYKNALINIMKEIRKPMNSIAPDTKTTYLYFEKTLLPPTATPPQLSSRRSSGRCTFAYRRTSHNRRLVAIGGLAKHTKIYNFEN